MKSIRFNMLDASDMQAASSVSHAVRSGPESTCGIPHRLDRCHAILKQGSKAKRHGQFLYCFIRAQ